MRELRYTNNTARTTRRDSERLKFKPLTKADIPDIRAILEQSGSRACDYTIGGLYMWADYFDYRFCIVSDTLFVSGACEDNMRLGGFAMPVGALSRTEALEMLKEYCSRNGVQLRLSAVPEDEIDNTVIPPGTLVTGLADWSDYLYDIEMIATLKGKKMSKKRNHVNRFVADNAGWSIEPLSPANIAETLEAYARFETPSADDTPSQINERQMTIEVLAAMTTYGFEGALLRDGTGRVVAFTAGEVKGDTLFAHIEKMDHNVAGAGEMIASQFAALMLARHPGLRYENREEDCGDQGLRSAKLSWQPAMLLRKYNITKVEI